MNIIELLCGEKGEFPKANIGFLQELHSCWNHTYSEAYVISLLLFDYKEFNAFNKV